MTQHLLIGLASIIVLGVSTQWAAWWLRVPAILLLLLCGLVAGPVTGLLNPDALMGDLLLPVVSISVAIILFEGGLTLRMHELPQIGRVLRNLVSVGYTPDRSAPPRAGQTVISLIHPDHPAEELVQKEARVE